MLHDRKWVHRNLVVLLLVDRRRCGWRWSVNMLYRSITVQLNTIWRLHRRENLGGAVKLLDSLLNKALPVGHAAISVRRHTDVVCRILLAHIERSKSLCDAGQRRLLDKRHRRRHRQKIVTRALLSWHADDRSDRRNVTRLVDLFTLDRVVVGVVGVTVHAARKIQVTWLLICMRHHRRRLQLDRLWAEEVFARDAVKVTTVGSAWARHDRAVFTGIDVEVGGGGVIRGLIEYELRCEWAGLLNLSAPFSDAGCEVFARRWRWDEVEAFWGV